MDIKLSDFTPLFSTSIVLNFAYIIASSSSKARLYLILNNRLTESVNSISKKSVKVDYYKYYSLMEYAQYHKSEIIAKELQDIVKGKENDIRKNILSKIALARKFVSVRYLSQASFILGIYSFFILFTYPLKLSNFNSCLFFFNITCSFILFCILFICENSKNFNWNFSRTTKFLAVVITLAISYLHYELDFTSVFESFINLKIDLEIKKSIHKFNLYFTIIFPFSAIIYYFLKGYIGTALIVRWYRINVFYYKKKEKYFTSKNETDILNRIHMTNPNSTDFSINYKTPKQKI